MSTRCFEFKVMLFIALFFVYGFSMTQAQTDVTDYETVTVSIPATSYDASKGPEMARVKYNKTFPLVITSDDMGKTELTNNWAEVNGYPNVSDWTHSRTDWTADGVGTLPTTFSSKPEGGYQRIFFQGHEAEWKGAVEGAMAARSSSAAPTASATTSSSTCAPPPTSPPTSG